MRLYLLCALLGLLSLAGCTPHSAPKPEVASTPVAAVPPGTPFGELIIGDPIVHENLTLFPILSKSPKNRDRFITLDEGLAAGTVKVMEVGAESSENEAAPDDSGDPFAEGAELEQLQVGDPFSEAEPAGETAPDGDDDPFGGGPVVNSDPFGGESDVSGEVNTLMVLNTSDKPLYLMPGEVIYGGQQNRTIGEELVIQPGNKPAAIDAYCVEQGRWSGRSIDTTTEHLAAAAEFPANLSLVISQTESSVDLAKRSQRGEFIASAGQLNRATRLAVHDKEDQVQVWEEVAKVNANVGNGAPSADFAGAYLEQDVVADLAPYAQHLEAVGQTDQIVGVAVAVDGQMVCVDIFESTPLFRKFWPKLLKSYALDAAATVNTESEQAEATKSCTVDHCVAFLKEMHEASAEAEEQADGQKVERRESKRGICFSYYDAEAAERTNPFVTSGIGVGLGGGLGGAVHAGGFAK